MQAFALLLAWMPNLPQRPPLPDRLPFAFVENLGQWEGEARFVARHGGATVWLLPDSITLQPVRRDPTEPEAPARGVNVRLVFEDASVTAVLEGRDERPTLYNYFLGNDPARWRIGVRGYERVLYRGSYEGVDLVARERGPDLEYDLLLAPGADLARVVVRVEGASEPLRLDSDGALVIGTALGDIRQPVPTAWEEGVRDERRPFACSYRLLGEDRFGFGGGERTPAFALIVDPGLLYSTFLGGSGYEQARTVALDGTGAAIVAGHTPSFNFPTSPGAYDPTFNGGANDAFVTRLPLSGGPLSYSTFLGGLDMDEVRAIALDATGAAVVVGFTGSTDFPTTPGAYKPAYSGYGGDAFVTRLSSSGSTLLYSTYLGGWTGDVARALALDTTGSAIVAGGTSSPDFPTTAGAYDPTFNGTWDAFVTRLPLNGLAPSYSTFLGAVGWEEAYALTIDAAGGAAVAGMTWSLAFPTTPGAFASTHNSPYDAFFTRLPLAGGPLSYSTLLGGSAGEVALAVVLDATGAAVVAGVTGSSDFPTTPGAYHPTSLGVDAFVTVFPLTGGAPSYSTFLGGSGPDSVYAVALDATGAAVVAGYSESVDFPTTAGAYDPTYNGGGDAFVAHLDLLPIGATAYGTSTQGCAGPLPIGVTSWPQVGNTGFAVTCGNAQPNSPGVLGLSGGSLSTPLPVLGAALWIDLSSPLVVAFAAASNALGAAQVGLPIPADPSLAGGQAYLQFFWPDPCAPGGVSASNALAITVQS